MYGNSAFAVSAGGGGGSVSLVVPNNAKLFAFGMDTVGSPGETFSFPAGFTPLTPQIINAGNQGGLTCLQLAWKDALSEPGTYNITWTHSGQLGVYGVFYFTGIAAGANAITFQVTQGPAGSSATSPVSAPLNGVVAPAGSDILWIPALCAAGAGTFSFVPPSGYTLHNNIDESARVIGLASNDGAGTGANTGTLTGSATGNGGDTMGIVLALSSSTPPAQPFKMYANGAMFASSLLESATPLNIATRLFANGTLQSTKLVEVAGANNRAYANGTFVSSQFIE
jgi:hypothetical protein